MLGLSKFHEKPYTKIFETIVVLSYVYSWFAIDVMAAMLVPWVPEVFRFLKVLRYHVGGKLTKESHYQLLYLERVFLQHGICLVNLKRLIANHQ